MTVKIPEMVAPLFGGGDVKEDALDESILNVDISVKRLVVVDHPSSFDQQFFILFKTEKEKVNSAVIFLYFYLIVLYYTIT